MQQGFLEYTQMKNLKITNKFNDGFWNTPREKIKRWKLNNNT